MQFIIELNTNGFGDIIDITEKINSIIPTCKFKKVELVNIFVIGSTASITTMENDTNLYKDFNEILEQIAPLNKNYLHHKTWGDDNGSAHIKASIIGPSITIPVKDKKLFLGVWQKVVLIDFDTRKRTRKIVITLSVIN